MMTNKQKKTLFFIICGVAIALTVLVAVYVGIPLVRFASEPEEFRLWVSERGLVGRLAFIGMVILQIIIAILPGEPFEIAAGYAFGVWEGTGLCILASTIGSMLVFLLVRKFGVKLAELFFSKEKIQSVDFLKSSPNRKILFFVLFMLPGTPKDLLCYYAGLTGLSVPAWLFICSVGRIPSIITSTIGGEALGTKKYLMAGVVFAVTLLISGLGILCYKLILKKHSQNKN